MFQSACFSQCASKKRVLRNVIVIINFENVCHILSFQSNNMLDEEAASDMHLKEQFGDKWTRTPSAKLTEGIRQEGDKYRSIINNAVQADAVVKEKYSTHK